jgi:hypothetical protein
MSPFTAPKVKPRTKPAVVAPAMESVCATIFDFVLWIQTRYVSLLSDHYRDDSIGLRGAVLVGDMLHSDEILMTT